MRTTRLWGSALVIVLLVCSAPPAFLAQTTDTSCQPSAANVEKRITELEKQLQSLRGELDTLKARNAAAVPASAVVQPIAPTAGATGTPVAGGTPAASAAPAAPQPVGGIESVLGGATLNGLVDLYYAYDVNQPKTRSSQFRAFDGPANAFALNLVELALDKTPNPDNSRLGYHLALGFGQAMNAVNGTDPGGLGFDQYLKEAYFSYLAPAGKGLQVDVGKFVTPHGAEVIESNLNWNYSRGLLFTYAIPYYHFGMRAKYTFSDKYSLTGYLVNGWNNVVENNSGKTVGLALGWNPNKKLSITQNYMAGPEMSGTNSHWRQLSDTVITYTATPRLSLTANADYGRGDRIAGLNHPVYWTGGAGYFRYLFNPKYALVGRYEYFNDHDGFTTGTAQHISEVTGTLERRIAQHLITRLEFRHDLSNQPSFLRGSTPVTGQSTVAAGMVFVLEPEENK